MKKSIAEIQAERKRNEREPYDWATYKQALIDCGLVEERRAQREAEAGYHGPDFYQRRLERGQANSTYPLVGLANAWPSALEQLLNPQPPKPPEDPL